jgi:glucose-6-phosphate isomerase
MYRDLRMTGDETLLAGHGLHYDVTVTLPGRLGDELMKTAGHYHNYVPGTVYTYTEVYEVLSGQAIFLLQRVRDPQTTLNETVVEEVLLIGARAGEVMLIPSHMGHVTINAGAEPLVVAALVSSSAGHQYGPFRQARGAAYYVLAPGMPPHTRANPAYGPLPQPRWYPSPTEAGLGLRGAVYQGFRRDPDRFAFLTDPTLL